MKKIVRYMFIFFAQTTDKKKSKKSSFKSSSKQQTVKGKIVIIKDFSCKIVILI